MIRDLAEYDRALAEDCEVCILGAGPAGIVSALELARQRPDWRIVVLEAGGFAPPAAEELDAYDGVSVGDPGYPLSGSRLRYLGGTSNHWGGWCRPFDAEDFAARAWIPRSGWPLERAALLPWYEKAAGWCEIGSTEYAEAALSPELGASILPTADSALLCNKYFRFSPPTRFGTRYRDDLEQATNVELLLHANATDLRWSGERVVGVAVRTGERSLTLRPQRVILALGGVESTRFLLMQTAAAPQRSGIASPMLGRCFADHFGLTPALAILPGKLQYARTAHSSGALMPVLALRPQAQESLQAPDFCITLTPEAEDGSLPPGYGDNRALGFRAAQFWRYRLQLICEPPARPDNCIRLLEERDHLGMPRLQLEWRVHPGDFASTIAALREVGIELGALGLGRLKLRGQGDYWSGQPGVGFHHLGSARMASDAEGGVVDADCRVHGVENLYVASSAIFPSCGFSNPTLSVVALAARLAAKLGQGAGSPPPEAG